MRLLILSLKEISLILDDMMHEIMIEKKAKIEFEPEILEWEYNSFTNKTHKLMSGRSVCTTKDQPWFKR